MPTLRRLKATLRRADDLSRYQRRPLAGAVHPGRRRLSHARRHPVSPTSSRMIADALSGPRSSVSGPSSTCARPAVTRPRALVHWL
jgi:hypothetical protein